MKYKNEYMELISKSLYEESFVELEKNVNALESKIEQKKHIRDFFSIVIEQFDEILEAGKIGILGSALIEALKTIPILKDTEKKLDSIFDNEHISIMFSVLLISNQFEDAKYLLAFFNKNVENFPSTVEEIINNKNTDALRFICENMDNIHYGNGEILRLASEMSSATLVSLIDEFNFDLNEQNKETGLSLIHSVTVNKNIRNFKVLVDKYSDKINLGQSFTLDNNQSANFFDFVDELKMQTEFYSVLLDKESLKTSFVERIGSSLFANDEVIKACSQTDIYNKLFSHNNFDPNVFNLEQGHFLYGLLSKVGIAAGNPAREYMAKSYVKIVDAFLQSTKEDSIPPAITYHIVGAAVFVASESQHQASMDCCTLILRRYPKYVNKPNPNGMMPIAQVAKDTPLYRLLINNGAITPDPEPTFWSGMLNMFGKKKKQDTAALRQIEEQQAQSTVTPAPDGSLQALRARMREDFRSMRQIISSDLCDPVIKMRCENMFLNSDNLVQKMEKHNIKNAYEDVHFLSQNFSSYLKQSLNSYMQVCEATVDFASQDKQEEKLKRAKDSCLEQINLLDQQLQLITDNIFSSVESSSLMSMRVRTKFLQEKIESSKTIDTEDLNSLIEDPEEKNVVSVLPKKKIRI